MSLRRGHHLYGAAGFTSLEKLVAAVGGVVGSGCDPWCRGGFRVEGDGRFSYVVMATFIFFLLGCLFVGVSAMNEMALCL